MAIRRYLTPLIGTGTPGDTLRPALAGIASGWRASDGRADATAPAGTMLVEADLTAAEHTAVLALAGVTYLPLDAAGSVPVGLDEPLSTMTAANRTALANRLEAIDVPLGWATGTTTPREVLRFAMRRLLLRQHLRADDWNEGLDTLVSAVPVMKRQRIAATLEAIGVDTSVIAGTDTLRSVLRKVAQQNIPALMTHLD